MAERQILGVPSPRVEGEEKVGGVARYAVDVVLPGMLWVKALRSPYAHAKIKRIDVAKAAAAPGVKLILTGAELRGVKIGKKIVDMPLLAEDVVRYVGEKVAAVVADNEAQAEAALDLLEVEYEQLPAVLDVLIALNISLSIIILLTTIYMDHPLDFSVFPSPVVTELIVILAASSVILSVSLNGARVTDVVPMACCFSQLNRISMSTCFISMVRLLIQLTGGSFESSSSSGCGRGRAWAIEEKINIPARTNEVSLRTGVF